MCYRSPAISIVIPVFNIEKYIGECLNSIFSSPGFDENCEVIIVDDGSEDGSVDIIERMCRSKKNAIIIQQKNSGNGAARNKGLLEARGKYIWFVDGDDKICSTAIENLVERIKLFSPEVLAFEFATIGGTMKKYRYLPVYNKVVDPIRFIISGRPPSAAWPYVFSRALLEGSDIKFQPGIFHEDALFVTTALTEAKSILRMPETLYEYRLRSGSIMAISKPEKHMADMLFIAEALGMRADQAPAGSAKQQALAREVGFALAAARYYAARSDRRSRQRTASLSRTLSAGARWWRHFPRRVLINYARLLGLAAFQMPLTRGPK